MELHTGIARKVTTSTETSGSVAQGRGSISTRHAASLVVDGRAVLLRDRDPILIHEGDRVSVVFRKDGGIACCCYKNHETGVVAAAPAATFLTMGLVFAVFGLITVWLYIGWFFLAVSPFALWEWRQLREATRRVGAAPAPHVLADARQGLSAEGRVRDGGAHPAG